MSSGTLLSIGSINADFEMRTACRINTANTFLASEFVRLSGGKGANVAFLANRLGCATTLIGRVGNDDLSNQALANLRRHSISLTHVTTATNNSTAVAIIVVPPDGKKTIILANNANDDWDSYSMIDAVSAIKNSPSNSVLVADFEVSRHVVTMCVAAAKDRGFKIIIDPAPPERVDLNFLLQYDAITPNAQEASALTGIDATTFRGAVQAALKLTSLGVVCVCVKLINGGCIVACNEVLLHIPPIPIDVVDATGAGDAFTSAFAVSILEGKGYFEAAIFGTAAAHLAVAAYGSQESYPDRLSIDVLAQEFRVENLDPKVFYP